MSGLFLMEDTRILYCYPFVFNRIRRVDSQYAYLKTDDGFVPLKRRDGNLKSIFPYSVYGQIFNWTYSIGAKVLFVQTILKSYDEITEFFLLKMADDDYEGFVCLDYDGSYLMTFAEMLKNNIFS
jgi:hypothetical protein